MPHATTTGQLTTRAQWGWCTTVWVLLVGLAIAGVGAAVLVRAFTAPVSDVAEHQGRLDSASYVCTGPGRWVQCYMWVRLDTADDEYRYPGTDAPQVLGRLQQRESTMVQTATVGALPKPLTIVGLRQGNDTLVVFDSEARTRAETGSQATASIVLILFGVAIIAAALLNRFVWKTLERKSR